MLEWALFAQVLVWLGVILVFLLTRQATIYHPLTIYLGFHGIVFVIRPLLVHFLEFDHEFLYMGLEPTERLLVRCLAVSSFGLVVFAGAALWFGKSRPDFQSPAPRAFTPEQRRALWVAACVLAPVIAYSMHASHTDFATEERGGTYVMVGAGGYTVEAQLMAGPLLCVLLAVARFRWYSLLLLIPYVGYRAYSGMSRWTIVLLLVAFALMFAWQKRMKWLPWWTLLFVLPTFLLFKALGENRGLVKRFVQGEHYRVEQQVEPGASARDKFRMQYDGPDFANFDFLAFVTAAVPQQTGTYTCGAQYLQLFTEPIPRKLWPGKPAGAPVAFFNLNSYGNFIGRTVTLVGDGWMSGGWLGVLVTMSLAGALLGRAHRWFWKYSSDNVVALFYLVGLAMLPQWFRDGGISIAKFLFWNLSPLGLWLAVTWLLGSRSVPGYSVVLPGAAAFHLLEAEAREPSTSDTAQAAVLPSQSKPLPS
ncbi:MAG TPA: hypothetical protein VNZ64_09920 [Candidatus Acidoferrum sp.]|jgi:hypothetical protein|nr:hypothetical protein [Candidatus Acidoferrum sp.]